jgi:hypothetical protein
MGSRWRKLHGVDQPLLMIGGGTDEREMAWNPSCMSSLGEEHKRGAEVPLPRLVEIRDVLFPGIDEKDAALGGLQQGRHYYPRAAWVAPPWGS